MEVIMKLAERISQLLERHPDVLRNPNRDVVIEEAVRNREAIVSANGALATWTPPESSGRSPKDTYLVRRKESEANIDWDSPNNIPLEPKTFDMIMEDALQMLSAKRRLYVTDRVLVADPSYAMPVRTVTCWASTACSGPCRPTSSGASLPNGASAWWSCLTTSWTGPSTQAGCGSCLTARHRTWWWPWTWTGTWG
jgi:hypothetical protein